MKKVLRSLIIAVAFMPLTSLWAQQDAQFTQFMFNQIGLNPAFTGSEHNFNVMLTHRNQWLNFPQGSANDPNFSQDDFAKINRSPTTTIFNANSAFGGSSLSGGHPMGAGLTIIQDNLGFESRLSVSAGFAYHIEFESNAVRKYGNRHLFFGLNFGFKQYGLNRDMNFDPQNTADPLLANPSLSVITPDIGAGILFKNEAYYIGVSVPHLIETKIKYSDFASLATKQARHYYAMAGKRFRLKDDAAIQFTPNVLMKYVVNAPTQFDLGLRIESSTNQKFWLGGVYRTTDAVGVMAGVNIAELGDPEKENRKFLLGFAYDFTISDIPTYNTGTYEVLMIFDLDLGRERNTKYRRKGS